MSQFNTSKSISTPVDPAKTKETECRKICSERFTYVIFYSVAVQYILFLAYLFSININIFPFVWLRQIFYTVISFKTWLLTLPLIVAIVMYGIINLKPFLKEKEYHPSRFVNFCKNVPHQTTILLLSVLIGLFTANLYIKYVKDEYKTLLLKVEGNRLLNEKYLFLMVCGAFMGSYHHFKKRISNQIIVFPIVYQSKYLQIREQIFAALSLSMFKSLLPVLHFLGFYLFTSGVFKYIIRIVFSLNVTNETYWENFKNLVDIRLMIYTWILSSHILSNMDLMNQLTIILSTEPKTFPIDGTTEIKLSEVMSLGKFQITQQLAALDFYSLAGNSNGERRRQFYTLSIPGGHPNNWKHLVETSLGIIDSFSSELTKSIQSFSKNNNTYRINSNQPTSNPFSDKVRTRYYNESYGMRNMTENVYKVNEIPTTPIVEKSISVIIQEKVESTKAKLMKTPVLFYLFGEEDTGKLSYLLIQQSQTVIWITQGLSSIIAHSIYEDSFGVVQGDIKRILKSYIRLKTVLDKIATINSKKNDRYYLALKSSVKRSIYGIVTEFSRFFDDLLLDQVDIQALHSFVTFREL